MSPRSTRSQCRRVTQELLDKINGSIDKMLADGTINELAVKYTEEATAE